MKNCDYRCNKCNFVFEFTKKGINDSFPTNPKCTKCGSSDTVRISWGNIIIPPNMKAV